MVHGKRLRPTYASVTATLALFVALGGGAYAATALPANSVGAKQIKKNAVERTELKRNAVDSTKVLDNSLTGKDVKESLLAKVPAAASADTARRAGSAASADTARRADSAASADTARHADSAAALDKAAYRAVAGVAPSLSGDSATAGCDPGQRVVGGGVKVDDPVIAWAVDSFPDGGNTAWTGRVGNSSEAPVGFTVYAICISVGATG